MMRFIKQTPSIKVFDVEENAVRKEERSNRHGELLPNSIRSIICGPSNCGKTNVIFTLLVHPKGLRFENVYVYSKSLLQPKYQMLSQILRRVKGLGYYPFADNAEIVSYDDVKPNSIFVFDDVACDKQDRIRLYFSMGRHKNVDCFYICQTYARIPKQLIRDNTTFLVLFKQDDINLHHVYQEHVGSDMSFQDFKEFCASCWNEDYGFVVIDKTRKTGRYRKGFDEFLQWL